jgi:protease IV
MGAVLARRRTSLRAVLQGLRRAARDARVRALVVKLGGSRSALGLAQAQELHDAVRDLRDHGKVTVAWAETFGEFGNGSVSYFLATSFEEIWLQPSGDVGLTGVATEVPFLRGVLDKAGITPQIAQRHEYKNAANVFTERGFTAAHREATERVVESVMEQLVATVAANRSLDAGVVRGLIDRAPLFSTEALEAGLVDRLGYRDDVYTAVRTRTSPDVMLQYLGRYRRSKLAELSTRVAATPADTVALVQVTGPIHLGRSRRQPLAGASAGADTVAAALRSATKADNIRAIVLRVVSPGGSYVASDAIWRQVALTRQAGKPVVVSMGDVAASGGYFVSMGADAIVAEPGTLTGSIGVVSGKQVVDGLVDRLGIGHEGVAGGRHGLMFSPLQAFTQEEWERLNVWLDRIYDDFTAKVADGRRLSGDRVHEIARGRVWTGADAKERGLVDELGGLPVALDMARQRAGLPPSDELDARVFPRLPLAARLRPAQSSEDPAAASARLQLEAWGPFADVATRLGLTTYGPLMLPAEHHLAW